MQKRNTEKTNAVLPPDTAPAGKPESSGADAPAGHGRNAASCLYRRGKGLRRSTRNSNRATLARNAAREKYTGRKSRQTLIRIVGQAPLKATVFEMERLRCNACCQVFTAAEPADGGTGEV